MEVILLERIEKLGASGDVVKVKNGYARNFLLPNGKALRANESNRKVFEANRERIETQNAERRGHAETDAKKIEGVAGFTEERDPNAEPGEIPADAAPAEAEAEATSEA